MTEAPAAAKRVARSLFSEVSHQELILECLIAKNSGKNAVHFVKPYDGEAPAWLGEKIPWGFEHSFFVNDSKAAAHDELHTGGTCYLLESSSIFMASPVAEITSSNMLDVCASPGGKSIVIGSSLRPENQVANEVIKKRLGALHGNLNRCGMSSVKIVSMDTGQLPVHLDNGFDLVVVDAPCSGQSLEMRGEMSPGCFLDVTINKCAMRQRRILANSASCLASGGHLLYSTCTFSIEENEKIIAWFLKQAPSFSTVKVDLLNAFQSVHTEENCYRLFPQHGLGSGGFCCLLRKE